MKTTWMCLALAAVPAGLASAQSSTEAMKERIRTCAQLPILERVDCLEAISREIIVPPMPSSTAGIPNPTTSEVPRPDMPRTSHPAETATIGAGADTMSPASSSPASSNPPRSGTTAIIEPALLESMQVEWTPSPPAADAKTPSAPGSEIRAASPRVDTPAIATPTPKAATASPAAPGAKASAKQPARTTNAIAPPRDSEAGRSATGRTLPGQSSDSAAAMADTPTSAPRPGAPAADRGPASAVTIPEQPAASAVPALAAEPASSALPARAELSPVEPTKPATGPMSPYTAGTAVSLRAAQPRPERPVTDKWLVSETMSPLDYSPVAIATAESRDTIWGSPIKLSIQCRGGRTDVVFSGASVTGRPEAYVISYSIDGERTAQIVAMAPPSGRGIALRGDVVGFLQALPAEGSVAFRIAAPVGPTLEGRYALPALKAALGRLARPCEWPAPSGLEPKSSGVGPKGG